MVPLLDLSKGQLRLRGGQSRPRSIQLSSMAPRRLLHAGAEVWHKPYSAFSFKGSAPSSATEDYQPHFRGGHTSSAAFMDSAKITFPGGGSPRAPTPSSRPAPAGGFPQPYQALAMPSVGRQDWSSTLTDSRGPSWDGLSKAAQGGRLVFPPLSAPGVLRPTQLGLPYLSR